MTVRELRERAAAEAKCARDIKDAADTEGRGLTEEEALKHDKHVKEARRIIQEAERQEDLETIEAKINTPVQRSAPTELADGSPINIEVGPRMQRYGQLRAFTGPKADLNAFRSGQFLLATVMGNARAQQFCRDHGIELRVQIEGSNTAGGFVVPDEMEAAIINLREEYGNARREARVVPMGSDHMVIPRRTGGVTAYFVGEQDAITASDKSWNQVELTAKKIGALTRMSTDLSEDAVINMADDLAVEMALAFATKEDQCAIDGDGTSTYGGMVGIRSKAIDGVHTYAYHDFGSSMDNWSEVTDAALMALMGKLPLYARRGAKWHCSPQAKVACFDRLILAAGGATMRERVDGVYRPQYMGYPIVEWPAMPGDDSSAALNNKVMFFFGNYAMAATLGTRRGITLKRSEERYIEYDQIAIQATERFCVVNHDIGTNSAYGPVICALGGS